MRISKYKNTFLYIVRHQIGLRKSLWSKTSKNTVPWTYAISDLNGEEIVKTFYEKEL